MEQIPKVPVDFQRRILHKQVVKIVLWVRNKFAKVKIKFVAGPYSAIDWMLDHSVKKLPPKLDQLNQSLTACCDKKVEQVVVHAGDERNTKNFGNQIFLLRL